MSETTENPAPEGEAAATDEQLLRARRLLTRRVAAALMAAMAETDSSFEQMAHRLGMKSDVLLRSWFHSLVDGDSKNVPLDVISDMFLGCGVQLSHQINAMAARRD